MFCLSVPTLLYLWEIYIFPRSVCLFCCREICGPILGIYKSLTNTWMWKLELRLRNSQKKNTLMGFSLQCDHYNILFHTGGGRPPVPLDGLWRERPLGPRTGLSVRRSLRAVRQRLPPSWAQPPAVRSGGRRRSATQPAQLGGHGPVHLHLYQAVFQTTVTENSAAEIERGRFKMRVAGEFRCWILAG